MLWSVCSARQIFRLDLYGSMIRREDTPKTRNWVLNGWPVSRSAFSFDANSKILFQSSFRIILSSICVNRSFTYMESTSTFCQTLKIRACDSKWIKVYRLAVKLKSWVKIEAQSFCCRYLYYLEFIKERFGQILGNVRLRTINFAGWKVKF